MADLSLKRQFITDTTGNQVGVILPLSEYSLVRDLLEARLAGTSDAEKLAELEQAASDPLFLADLRETMAAFADVDGEGWEEPTT